MSDDSADQTKRGSGRGLAALAVLVAFGAAGLAAFPYYQKYVGGSPQLVTLDALRDAQGRDASELRSALQEVNAQVEERWQQQQAQLTERFDAQDARAAIARDTADVAASAARFGELLRLAQAQALLQSANDRVALTGDAAGGLALLIGAQQLLASIDTPDVLIVRGTLTDEIKSLRDAPTINVNAIFMRLEALKYSLPELPSRSRKSADPTPGDATERAPQSVWLQVAEKFFSLFQFRRHSSDGAAPLTVDEVIYVRLNLELLMQTAQIALLRGDAAVYRESLTTAYGWLNDYRANAGDAVDTAQAEIDQLLAQPLDRPLPDVSGAVLALRSILGTASALHPVIAVEADPVAKPETPAMPQAEAASQADPAPDTAEPDDAS